MSNNLTNTLNQNLDRKRQHQFYVEFLGLPQNTANFLGRQVMETEVPAINFNITEPKEKKYIRKYDSNFTFEEISVQLYDDVSGITMRMLMDMGFLQHAGKMGFFDMMINILDNDGHIIMKMRLKDCIIRAISTPQLSYQGGIDSIITLTLFYYNLEITDFPVDYKEEMFSGYHYRIIDFVGDISDESLFGVPNVSISFGGGGDFFGGLAGA